MGFMGGAEVETWCKSDRERWCRRCSEVEAAETAEIGIILSEATRCSLGELLLL